MEDINERPVNLQDTFLNQLRKENMPATVFLINGYQIKALFAALTSLPSHRGGGEAAAGLQARHLHGDSRPLHQPATA